MESQNPSVGEIVPTIQNVISTVNLDCNLDLHRIKLCVPSAEYGHHSQCMIMRMMTPKSEFMIYASGRMVCTGAKSDFESKLTARKCARIIQNLGFPAWFKDFKIQNIVANCDVRFPIRIEGLAAANPKVATYEPESSPGLRYNMKEPKVTILVFTSGKVEITEAKCREDMQKAFELIYPALEEFKNIG